MYLAFTRIQMLYTKQCSQHKNILQDNTTFDSNTRCRILSRQHTVSRLNRTAWLFPKATIKQCCYNEAVRQKQGYVNKNKNADNEIKQCGICGRWSFAFEAGYCTVETKAEGILLSSIGGAMGSQMRSWKHSACHSTTVERPSQRAPHPTYTSAQPTCRQDIREWMPCIVATSARMGNRPIERMHTCRPVILNSKLNKIFLDTLIQIFFW